MSFSIDNYEPPACLLSVSDVERLAKAGVTIKFTEIKNQIKPDDQMVPQPMFPPPRTLEEAFWDRWKRAHLQRDYSFDVRPYNINASEHGGKVYVFVSPGDQPPFILDDDAVLYPSDALMAKLALYEKSK